MKNLNTNKESKTLIHSSNKTLKSMNISDLMPDKNNKEENLIFGANKRSNITIHDFSTIDLD